MEGINIMKKIYFLDYVYEFEDGHDDIKLLGVFSSKKNAKLALEKIKENPKYKKIAKYIVISDDLIGRLGWEEGYITAFY